jgi:hypothetical protein
MSPAADAAIPPFLISVRRVIIGIIFPFPVTASGGPSRKKRQHQLTGRWSKTI